jgi:hypothetical protein
MPSSRAMKKPSLSLRRPGLTSVWRSWLAQASERLRLVRSRARSPISSDDRVALLVAILIIGFVIAVAYHYVMGTYFGREWPANTFLFRPWDRFWDFTQVVLQSSTLDPFGTGGLGFAGSPFGQFVGYLFSVIRPASLRLPIFLGSFFIGFALLAKHFLYGLRSRLSYWQLLALFAIVFLTYPVLFAADRANLDLLVLPFLFLFALTYAKQQYKTSTVFLGLAVALKPYAAIIIMVYVFDRRYRDTLLVLFNVVFLSALSLALFKDGLIVETQRYFHAISGLVSDPSLGSDMIYTSDLYSMLTIVARPLGDILHSGSLMHLADHPSITVAYAVLALLLSAYMILHLWQEPRPLWKTMAVLTILIILLPINSHDYRLIYLFVPMLMYLAADDTGRSDLVIVLIWGLLLVPKNYYVISGEQNIGMLINPVLLIGLLMYISPSAFSTRGALSTFGFARARLRALVECMRWKNPRSSSYHPPAFR